jgi:hypothetical protein
VLSLLEPAGSYSKSVLKKAWKILVFVVILTPQAMGRLLAIRPYMAELLAVVTVRKNILSFIRLNFHCNMTKS